jgi:hypothetical protein
MKLPRSIKHNPFYRGILFCIGILSTLATVSLFAVAVNGTFNTFSSGSVLRSSDINANFATLKSAIESIPNWTKSGTTAVYSDGNVRINGRISSSVLGTYCGATAASVTGNMGGYTGAKALCETACSNTNAHMCTAHEMIISMQLGISFPVSGLWYSTYVRADAGGQLGQDCYGWTVTTNDGAASNGSSNGQPNLSNCSASRKVACCL